MLLVKKIVGPLFFPMTLVLGMLILGLFFLFLTKRQKTGKVLVLIGTLSLGLLGYDGISESILGPLEYKYPPVLTVENHQTVKWIVVLGGGHTSDPNVRAFYEYLISNSPGGHQSDAQEIF
jgi:uncharacterized SAM-binding protein YcdF (DUF218 family)